MKPKPAAMAIAMSRICRNISMRTVYLVCSVSRAKLLACWDSWWPNDWMSGTESMTFLVVL